MEHLALAIPELLTTVVILLLAVLAFRFGARGVTYLRDHTHLDRDLALVLRRILRFGIVVLTLLAICQTWGVLENVWAAATATLTLVAIGFVAVWSVLSNVLCSIILLAKRPFRIGDRLELPPDDIAGTVVNIDLAHTILKTDDGAELHVPNNLFFQRVVKRRRRGETGPVATPTVTASGEAI